MDQLVPMRNLPTSAEYKEGDVLVIFGELFSKGYANGLVEAAERRKMTVINATVGRRDSDGSLRALNDQEAAEKARPFINIPLEAGFDMEPADDGTTPCDQLKGVKISGWKDVRLDWDKTEQSRKNAIKRFEKNTSDFLVEVKKHIPDGANVLFAHTMAGGVPRAKILMPVMNKVFKGRGDRYLSSKEFWESDLGRLCSMNFDEVTADTFKTLVESSTELRKEIEGAGGQASYVAFGYHGTEVLVDNEYKWQSYSPYVQGWAKKKLEDYSIDFSKKKINTSVYNCPEILTNSSSIFLGVEVCLYRLIAAYRKEFSDPTLFEGKLKNWETEVIKPEHSFNEMLELTEKFAKDPLIQSSYAMEGWPQHNSKEQMELLLETSTQIIDMHKDPKNLITFPLSEEIFRSTGELMLTDSWHRSEPVWWLNHDICAKQAEALAR